MKALVQREEFQSFFVQTPYYNRCEDFSVLDCKYEFDFEALFQHYGFASSYVDITKELLVALFFAYTYSENGKYYPIEDFNKYDPTLYVSQISCIQKIKEVLPISLQMVKRPLNQMAMAINTNGNDVKSCFEIYKLPQNPLIAIDIYEKFLQGSLLFQNEPVSDVALQILASTELNSTILKSVCTKHNVDFNYVQRELEKEGFVLTDIKWSPNEEMRIWMNNDIDTFWMHFLEKVSIRKCSPMFNE